MQREQSLRRRLQSQETLYEAIAAMKSLSAHYFRLARTGLAAARAYRTGIDDVLAAIGLAPPVMEPAPPGLVLIASDLGLCDGYNARLVQKVVEQHVHLQFRMVYSVGRRPVSLLQRAGMTVTRLYQTPTSVSDLTRLLLSLAQEILSDHVAGKFANLYVISARFEGIGVFTPVCTQIWPVPPARPPAPMRPSAYVSREQLVMVALREFFYIMLFQILLDSLAAEHSTRLVATASAAEWLKTRIVKSRHQLATIRREAMTQELLDVVSGARHQRRPEDTPDDRTGMLRA
jgi:F-type H+-transporting ATPase subunit gamma